MVLPVFLSCVICTFFLAAFVFLFCAIGCWRTMGLRKGAGIGPCC